MRSIFYLTFNGVVNNTNGIGTQTKTHLEGFSYFYQKFKKKYGEISFNIITPEFDINLQGYSEDDYNFTVSTLGKLNGKIYFCKPSKTIGEFWTPEYWEKLSKEASEIISREASKYEDTLVICVDPPFLHTPLYFNKRSISNTNLKWLMALYSTSYIHDKDLINNDRLAWEYIGISSSRLNKNVYLAKVCNFMENHLIEYYGAPSDKFVPYESSLFLQSNDFEKLNEKEIKDILIKFNIPLNKKILFAFGRAHWIKGFDTLLESLSLTKEDFHFVFIAVSNPGDTIQLEKYLKLLKNTKYSYTIIPKFSRVLPKALCQWYNTKLVVCPSRGEPFSNIPLEVPLWSREKGPIILASNLDGFQEQIKNAVNGYLFTPDSPKSLAKKIDYIFSLNDSLLLSIRKLAYKKVEKERDFFINFSKTLNKLWIKNI